MIRLGYWGGAWNYVTCSVMGNGLKGKMYHVKAVCLRFRMKRPKKKSPRKITATSYKIEKAGSNKKPGGKRINDLDLLDRNQRIFLRHVRLYMLGPALPPRHGPMEIPLLEVSASPWIPNRAVC